MRKIYFITLCIIILLSGYDCSCSQSGRRGPKGKPTTERRPRSTHGSAVAGSNIVKMKKQGGVYYVPCKINGQAMEFIFDTGASDITMSITEALFLMKQGKMFEDDFIGLEQYQIADGSIAEGTVVNLRTVEIGNKKLENIKASIVHNMEAPLLLGQSALSKFGKISIDYNHNELKFE
jgi:aspartyl protease family protein